MLCVQYCTETATVNLVGQDGHQQQFDTQAALLVPISGPIDPVVDRRGFTGMSKDHL